MEVKNQILYTHVRMCVLVCVWREEWMEVAVGSSGGRGVIAAKT